MSGAPDRDKNPAWSYRLASAFAHGFAWSLLLSKLDESVRIAPGVHKGIVSANEGVVLIVGERTIHGFELAIANPGDVALGKFPFTLAASADFERYVGA